MSKEAFFEGLSISRNNEIMRIFKDLEMAEQLGSGISRILEYYGKEFLNFPITFAVGVSCGGKGFRTNRVGKKIGN